MYDISCTHIYIFLYYVCYEHMQHFLKEVCTCITAHTHSSMYIISCYILCVDYVYNTTVCKCSWTCWFICMNTYIISYVMHTQLPFYIPCWCTCTCTTLQLVSITANVTYVAMIIVMIIWFLVYSFVYSFVSSISSIMCAICTALQIVSITIHVAQLHTCLYLLSLSLYGAMDCMYKTIAGNYHCTCLSVAVMVISFLFLYSMMSIITCTCTTLQFVSFTAHVAQSRTLMYTFFKYVWTTCTLQPVSITAHVFIIIALLLCYNSMLPFLLYVWYGL